MVCDVACQISVLLGCVMVIASTFFPLPFKVAQWIQNWAGHCYTLLFLEQCRNVSLW